MEVVVDVWIKPNWHAVMVHLPIGLLVAGVTWELLGVFFRKSRSARAAGRWMVLCGAVLGIPTALSGVYAYTELFPHGLAGIEDATLREDLSDHVLLQSVAAGVALLLATVWIGLSDTWRGRLHWVLVLLLTVTLGATLAGAHHGGKLVYEHGVAVKTHTTPAGPLDAAEAAFDPESPDVPAIDKSVPAIDQVEAGLPPVQTHVVIAGFALALASVSLGLAARAVSQAEDWEKLAEEQSVQRIAAAFTAAPQRPAPPAQRPYADEYGAAGYAVSGYSGRPTVYGQAAYADPSLESRAAASFTQAPPPGWMPPAARFWVLTALLLIASSVTGFWVLAADMHPWTPQTPEALWKAVTLREDNDGRLLTRRYAHVIAGGSLVGLTLVLAALARFARRRKFLLGFFGLLLVAAIAAQAWLGTVLILEGSQGPVTKWNEKPE